MRTVRNRTLTLEIDADCLYHSLLEIAGPDAAPCEFEEALGLVSETRQLVAADPELDFLLGEIRRGQGDRDAALAAYEAALQVVYPASWDPRGSRR